MKKDLVEQLRRFSFIPGKQKTWISELSDDQLYILFSKLRNGQKARSIASYVQKELKISPKSTVHSISQGILKYQKRIAHLLLTPASAEENLSGDFQDSESDDDLTTMENIASQWEGRIKRMISEERKTGVCYPYINRDLQALASLRKAILKQKEWESTHSDPLRRKGYERVKARMGKRFNGFIETLGDEGRERVIQWADKFLELVEQNAVTMEQKEDGTNILIKD
jgi:hypothetical protein